MRLHNVHVAVVDDDDSVRRAVGRLLRVAGMDVEVYASGNDFLNDLENHLPDCVVLDMYMPSMTGLDVQASMIARHLQLPVIFITAHDDQAAEQRAIAAGAVAFLHKPFTEQLLIAAIEDSVSVDTGPDESA